MTTGPARTGAAAGHTGYFHEAVCYDTDEHLLAVVVPFLLGGAAAGEPTLVAFGERTAALVRAALPPGCPVEFLALGEVYARPAGAIRAYRKLMAEHVAAGAAQIRLLGELPPQALGAAWDWWARYEATVNHAYDEFPLWSMCAYDARSTPPAVLADVARTHPRTARPGERHEPNADFGDPEAFLLASRPPPPDPIQAGPPLVDLTGPTAAEARDAVRAAGDGRVTAADAADLVLAVSEIVTNAQQHGRPPYRMRLWAGDGRMVVVVDDSGAGLTDPYAGLLPFGGTTVTGGLGLWIAHQSCSHVSLHRSGGGFTVRLTAGPPYAS